MFGVLPQEAYQSWFSAMKDGCLAARLQRNVVGMKASPSMHAPERRRLSALLTFCDYGVGPVLELRLVQFEACVAGFTVSLAIGTAT